MLEHFNIDGTSNNKVNRLWIIKPHTHRHT